MLNLFLKRKTMVTVQGSAISCFDKGYLFIMKLDFRVMGPTDNVGGDNINCFPASVLWFCGLHFTENILDKEQLWLITSRNSSLSAHGSKYYRLLKLEAKFKMGG